MVLSSIPSRRLRLAAIHLFISTVIAGIAAAVVFGIWYPRPYASLAGGAALFLMLVGIDVVLGPALTLLVAAPTKPMAELRRDILLVALVQAMAFAYGIYSIASARPVFLSFEVDRFRVVTAADVDHEALQEAPEGLRTLPWLGPVIIAAVKPTDPAEQMRSIELGLQGLDLSMIPRNWRTYESMRKAAWRAAKPLSSLIANHPSILAGVRAICIQTGQTVEAIRFLPVLSRQRSWVILMSPDSDIVGFLPVDGFI